MVWRVDFRSLDVVDAVHRLVGVLLWLLWLLWPFAATAEKPLDLVFVGDVSFAGRPLPPAEAIVGDESPFRAVRSLFAAADLVVANAEGLLTEERPAAYRERRLDIGASPRWAPAFAAAGVDLVGLANNHTWDAGAPGVRENRAHLSKTGVAVYGAGPDAKTAEAAWRLPDDDRCVAIVPATLKSNRPPRPGAAAAYYRGPAGLKRLAGHVSALAGDGCFVIVSVHWGREGSHHPTRREIHAAHALADAGARVVVGHHPHVLQGVEHYRGALIAYSLGNFVFTNRNPDKRETGLLRLRLTREGPPKLLEVALLPATIDPRGFVPRPSTPRQRERTARRLAEWSRPLGTRATLQGDRIVFTPLSQPR